MKYLIPLILIILAAGTVYGTYLFLPMLSWACN
jgi:hypothetical protein